MLAGLCGKLPLTLLGRPPNLRRPLIQGENARRHFSARQEIPARPFSPLAQQGLFV